MRWIPQTQVTHTIQQYTITFCAERDKTLTLLHSDVYYHKQGKDAKPDDCPSASFISAARQQQKCLKHARGARLPWQSWEFTVHGFCEEFGIYPRFCCKIRRDRQILTHSQQLETKSMCGLFWSNYEGRNFKRPSERNCRGTKKQANKDQHSGKIQLQLMCAYTHDFQLH